jgi:hypothetical protein
VDGFDPENIFEETIDRGEDPTISSPKDIPETVETEGDMWALYFPMDLIEEWTKKTNERFAAKNIRNARGIHYK